MSAAPFSFLPIPSRGARILTLGCGADGCQDVVAAAACSLGHLPKFVSDPTVAREQVESADLLLLDLDAFTDPLILLAHLWCAQPELPVVCVASKTQRALREGALRMGVMTVLPTPVDVAELRVAIRLALEQSHHSAVQFTRELARTMSSLQTLMGDAVDVAGLQPVLDEIARLFRSERASLLLFDDPSADDARLKLVAHVGFPEGIADTVIVSRGEGVAGRVAQEGIPQLLLRSLKHYARFSDLFANEQITASLAVPVRATGARGERPVLGVLNLARYSEGDVFTPRDLEVCEFIATSIGELLTRLHQSAAQNDLQQRMAAVEKLACAGEIAAGIAHEVASPVTSVHANLQVLAEYLEELAPVLTACRPGLAPELTDVLDDLPVLVEESVEGTLRAMHIVDEMKSMVRLETGNEPRRPVALKAIVESTLRLLRPRLLGRCRVEIDLDPDARVLGRQVELSQVLVNLLVNAADACDARQDPDGEGNIRVAVRRESDACVVSVSDDGIGISSDQHERIFAPLFTTKSQGGTGLGLGIVRRIVEAHGGAIELSSTPGEGTTFWVRLPRVDEAKARTSDSGSHPAPG